MCSLCFVDEFVKSWKLIFVLVITMITTVVLDFKYTAVILFMPSFHCLFVAVYWIVLYYYYCYLVLFLTDCWWQVLRPFQYNYFWWDFSFTAAVSHYMLLVEHGWDVIYSYNIHSINILLTLKYFIRFISKQ